MKITGRVIIILICVFLLILGLIAFTLHKGYENSEEQATNVTNSINQYYRHLKNPVELYASVSELQTINPNKLTYPLFYLVSKGYNVEKSGEPIFISTKNSYAIYDVKVTIHYPEDFCSIFSNVLLPKTTGHSSSNSLSVTERLWVNIQNDKICIIESNDPFVVVRSPNIGNSILNKPIKK